jgi:TM2 domain-containing membrane protein YozV
MNNTSQYIHFQVHKRSTGIALLFCVFFGMLGLHRFYLGKESTGAAMLILTVTIIGLPVALVWSIVDLFMVSSFVREHNIQLAEKLDRHYGGDDDDERGYREYHHDDRRGYRGNGENHHDNRRDYHDNGEYHHDDRRGYNEYRDREYRDHRDDYRRRPRRR